MTKASVYLLEYEACWIKKKKAEDDYLLNICENLDYLFNTHMKMINFVHVWNVLFVGKQTKPRFYGNEENDACPLQPFT